MGIFARLFKVGQLEANAAIDKLEDPIKMTEQGIRDLKNDLNQSLNGLAEVKAMAIRANNDMAKYKDQADNYEHKAMLLLQKAERGEIAPAEADRLASEALQKKAECEEQYQRSAKDKEQFDKSVAQIEVKTRQLRSSISSYENELKTLKARDKVNKATTNLNKQHLPVAMAESHLAIHTFPEKELCYVELSSCNAQKNQLFQSLLSSHFSCSVAE